MRSLINKCSCVGLWWNMFILVSSLSLWFLHDLGVITSAPMRDVLLESMLRGHHMTWNLWSPHMRGNTTMMFLLPGIAVILTQHRRCRVLLLHHLLPLSLELSHPKLMEVCICSTGPLSSVDSTCMEEHRWLLPSLATRSGWAKPISLALPWLDWAPQIMGSFLVFQCIILTWDSNSTNNSSLWGNQMSGVWWCPKENPMSFL